MDNKEFKKLLKLFYSLRDSERASGRTTILAEVLVETAIENLGVELMYNMDHDLSWERSHRNSRDLLFRMENYLCEFNHSHGVSLILVPNRRRESFKIIVNPY